MSLIKKTRESSTMSIVLPAAALVMIKFALADLDVAGLNFPEMSATEFGIAFAAILAVWLGREWRSAHYAGKD